MKIFISILIVIFSFSFQIIDFPYFQNKNISIKDLTKSKSDLTRDTIICNNWILDTIIIKQVLKDFSQITNSEWHYQFDHLPCSYKGTLIQNNQKIIFEINSGSWASIQLKDTTFLIGDIDRKFEKYFITTFNNQSE
jgi:hypothetical protein